MKKISFKHKILIYSVFLILSFILWILDSLSREYKTTIKVPVEFKKIPNHKMIQFNKLPKYLNLIINGYGYAILSYNLKSKLKPITINLSQLNLYQINPNDTTNYYILLHEAEKQIASQLKQNLKILDIKPDTVYITFVQIKQKTVKVIPLVKIHFAKQYRNVGQPKIEPQQVKIFGPSSIIDTIEKIYTQKITLYDVNQDIDLILKINTPPTIAAKPDKIHYFLKVEMFTEKRIKVKITPTNVPKNYKLRLFPSYATVIAKVSISNYHNIDENDFTLIVDYRDLQENPSDKLPVKLIYKPENVYSVEYFPKVVDYILETTNQ